MVLKGKNILFISSNYFGYYKHVIRALISRGAFVDWFPDVPISIVSKLKNVILNKNVSYEDYYDNLKAKLASKYDFVLLIKGDVVPHSFLEYIHSRYDGAKFIMYHWDDIDLFPSVIEKFKYFDRILSYNILDCEKYNLTLRPVFFVPQNGLIKDKHIDALIVGSFNSVRGQFIKQFKQLNPEVGLYSHYYINPLIFIKEKLDWSTRNEFKFHKLSYNDMMSLVAISKACIDVPHSHQQGLTTRSIEALPFETKIITTNKNIKLYDYYSPINHYIVDINNPIIEKDWINEPYEKLDEDLVMKYTIDYWVNDIFGF